MVDRKLRILLIDDTESWGQMLRDVVEHDLEGMAITDTASTPSEGLSKIQASPYDYVLVDVTMGGFDFRTRLDGSTSLNLPVGCRLVEIARTYSDAKFVAFTGISLSRIDGKGDRSSFQRALDVLIERGLL